MRFLIVPPRSPPFLGGPLPFPPTAATAALWRRGLELGMSVGVDLPCGAGGGVSLPPAEGFALLPGDLNWGRWIYSVTGPLSLSWCAAYILIKVPFAGVR